MGVNRYHPHMFVLPEDDANRQLANGFALEIARVQVQVLREAGGWLNVCESFERDRVQAMRNYSQRSLVLLIDFDADADRRQRIRQRVPDDLAERVFVVGAWSEPEALRRCFSRSFEEIGRSIATECRSRSRQFLGGDLLKHNLDEIDRLCVPLAAIR